MPARDSLRRGIGVLLLAAALAVNAFASFFGQELLAEAAILALFALSLDILATCGLVSFGHAGFLGVGAYVFGGLTVLAGLPPAAALAGALAAGLAAALVVGPFAVRTSGAFFIMVTLAVAEMFFAWAFRSRLFNGADGMGGVPRLDLSAVGLDLNDPSRFALAMVLCCAALWVALEMVLASPFGRTLNAIRQNANRVAALGGRVFALRLAAFALSGVIGAFAGAMKVQHTNFLSPDLASWFVSGDVLIAVVIGGIGTLVGGMLGAAVLVLLKDVLSGVFGHWYLFLGVIFGLVAILLPRGVVGGLLDMADARAARRRGAKETLP
ncbi:MAG TPA: branched-chain amino acid ABC transporter permease [Beijerinckiaceae bacterium]